jgi:predicted transposase YbfD/YdcC
MGCQTTIAQSTLDAGADYLLAVKDNQPTLHAEIESYFATAPAAEVEKVETIDKDHGRFEVRNYSVSHQVDWYAAERSYPGAPRFPHLTTIAMVESRIERGDKIESERRSYISSRALSAAAFAAAARGHWAIENKLHWGAKNMAVVRHFALNLVRQVVDKRSIKRRRKRAAWNPQYLLDTLGPLQTKPC